MARLTHAVPTSPMLSSISWAMSVLPNDLYRFFGQSNVRLSGLYNANQIRMKGNCYARKP